MSKSTDQTVQENLATVRAMFAAVATRGDPADFEKRWAAYVDRYDPNAVIHESPSLPYGGEYAGVSGIAAHAQGYGSAWAPFQDPELQDLKPTFVADGDKVVVLWRQRGRDPKSGESFDMPATSVYTMKDGRVLESRMFHYDVGLVRDFLSGGSSAG
jgi:hypothetical protein